MLPHMFSLGTGYLDDPWPDSSSWQPKIGTSITNCPPASLPRYVHYFPHFHISPLSRLFSCAFVQCALLASSTIYFPNHPLPPPFLPLRISSREVMKVPHDLPMQTMSVRSETPYELYHDLCNRLATEALRMDGVGE